jgi:hypothetical protein
MSDTSDNGWPVLETAPAGTLDWITGKLLPGDVHTIFNYLCREFDEKVEKIDKKNSCGYYKRTIKGNDNVFSNHASGTAIDLNYNKHQYGKANTFTAKQVEAIRKILKDLSGAVRWGGDYKTKDDMHFEIVVNQKGVSDAAKKIGGGNVNSVPVYQPPTAVLKRNTKNDQVKWLQTALNKVMNAGLAIDGSYGPLTETAVKNFQTKNKLAVDGIFGPKSLEKMLTLYKG